MGKFTVNDFYHLEQFLEERLIEDTTPENLERTDFYYRDLPNIRKALDERKPVFWLIVANRSVDFQTTRVYRYDDYYEFNDFKNSAKSKDKVHAFYVGNNMLGEFFAEEISEDLTEQEVTDFLRNHRQ